MMLYQGYDTNSYQVIMTPPTQETLDYGDKGRLFFMILLCYIPNIRGGIDGSIQWFYVGDFTNIWSTFLWQPSSGHCYAR